MCKGLYVHDLNQFFRVVKPVKVLIKQSSSECKEE